MKVQKRKLKKKYKICQNPKKNKIFKTQKKIEISRIDSEK